jgi:hypothetical protein
MNMTTQQEVDMDLTSDSVEIPEYSFPDSKVPIYKSELTLLDLHMINQLMPEDLRLHTVEVHEHLSNYLEALDLNSGAYCGPLGLAYISTCPTCILLCRLHGADCRRGASDALRQLSIQKKQITFTQEQCIKNDQ